MPRTCRLRAPDTLHHLIARFVNREFRMEGPAERAEYLRRVAPVLANTDGQPLSYALMSSHVHWGYQTGHEPASRFVHRLHTGFASWLNRTEARTGPVFSGRFSAVLCNAERAAELIAYQHNNPVRAGVVSDPADSTWTSHRAFVGLEAPPPWLDVGRALSLCGFDSSPRGRLGFHAFVVSRASSPREGFWAGGDPADATRRARVVIGAPAVLSDGVLSADIRLELERQAVVRRDGAVRLRWPGSAADALRSVCQANGVEWESAVSRIRSRGAVATRKLACWMWTRELGRMQAEMNAVLGLSSSAGSYCVRSLAVEGRARARSIADELWARAGNELTADTEF